MILELEEADFERQEAIYSKYSGTKKRKGVAGLKYQASHSPLQAGTGPCWAAAVLGL